MKQNRGFKASRTPYLACRDGKRVIDIVERIRISLGQGVVIVRSMSSIS